MNKYILKNSSCGEENKAASDCRNETTLETTCCDNTKSNKFEKKDSSLCCERI